MDSLPQGAQIAKLEVFNGAGRQNEFDPRGGIILEALCLLMREGWYIQQFFLYGQSATRRIPCRIREDPAFPFFPEGVRGSLIDRQKSDPVKDTASQWDAKIHQFGLEAPGGEVEEKPRNKALSVARFASIGEVLGNN